jgi:hypothetical protein
MAASGVEVGSHKPSPTKYTGPPMDLANMRHNGVRALDVTCLACGHHADVNVDSYAGHLAVPSFAKRMKCSKCESRKISVRPAWRTKPNLIPPPG